MRDPQDALKRVPLWVVGAIASGLIVLITVVVFSGIYRKPFEPASHKVTADFERATQLHSGDEVRIDGNIDGKVASVEPSPDGQSARVTMNVNDDAGPIYADATARLRFKTLLGASFYVDLNRGNESAGDLGGQVIPSEHTGVQTEIEDLTNSWRDGAGPGFQTLPHELAKAFSNPNALPDLLKYADQIAPEATRAVNAVRGLNQDQDLQDLVATAAKTADALDSNESDLHTLVSGAASTVEVTGNRSAEIQQTLHEGPGVTSDLTNTLARLNTTLDITSGLVNRLNPAADNVGPTLQKLRPTLVSTSGLLHDATPLVKLLQPTVSGLANAGGNGIPFVNGLIPSLNRTDNTILPYLWRKDPVTGKPTTTMIGSNLASFTDIASFMDTNGHFIRFPASGGDSSTYIPCTSKYINGGASALAACDDLNTAISEYLNYTGPGQMVTGYGPPSNEQTP